MKIFLFLVFFLIIQFYFLPQGIRAQSGCCSHHGGVSGCNSQTGRQVCNDGSFSPTCTCAYIPPQPTFPQPDLSSATANSSSDISTTNSCNLDVTVNWQGGINSDRYSLALSKFQGSDPGPGVDTALNTFKFTNISPGTWYLNIKPGNQNVWGKIWSWTVDVPKVTPTLNASIDNYSKTITYSAVCTKNLTILPKSGSALDQTSGVIAVSTDSATTYILTASDNAGNLLHKELNYVPVVYPPANVESSNPNSNANMFLGLAGLGILGGVVYLMRGKANKKIQSTPVHLPKFGRVKPKKG